MSSHVGEESEDVAVCVGLSVASWNIGGGILGASHQTGADATLEYYVSIINSAGPDILCLQETHEYRLDKPGQAVVVAEAAGFPYVHAVPVSSSHLDSDAYLSLAIMARYPIVGSTYVGLPNPELTAIGPNGERWQSHDKGYIFAELALPGLTLHLVNAHCYPFHHFGASAVDPEHGRVWSQLASDLIAQCEYYPTIAALDLNHDPVEEVLSPLFTNGLFQSAFTRTPTIPQGRQHDYILYTPGSLRLRQTSVIPTESDHHFCLACFSIEKDPSRLHR